MSRSEHLSQRLILQGSFKYYLEDEFLIQKVLSFVSCEEPCVLDVGCGRGHYAFLFEKCGANVIGFDCNVEFIEENRKRADLDGSSVTFITADGSYPEKYFTASCFDVIFMSGFSLFGTNFSRSLMEKYLNLLTHHGVLVFIQNSNLRGDVRKTHWRNYSIGQLSNEFSRLNCNVEKVFFYDRHIIGRILRSYVFSDASTACHRIITRLSGLPCNVVMIISRKEKT